MTTVYIVSIGPGDPALLTQNTMEYLTGQHRLLLRTGRHLVSPWLKEQGVPFETLDALYDMSDDFNLLAEEVAKHVWESAARAGSVVFAVPDALTDRTVDAVFAGKPENGSIVMVPGFSYADYYLSACRGLFSTADIRICPASSLAGTVYDPSLPILIPELNDEITAGEVKTFLSSRISDEETVWFLQGDAAPDAIPLYELDRQKNYSHLSAVAVPGSPCLERDRKTLDDLLWIMDLLRSPDGCPWDRKQTHETLRPFLVEEAWETVDAIEEDNPDHLAEELGDLLFQIVFHASIGKSFDEFTMDDIVTGITNKMIRRHPHVFRRETCDPAAFSAASWDKIKREESGGETLAASLNRVSPALPSLRYAEKIIGKLAQLPGNQRSAEEIRVLLSFALQDLLKADASDAEPKLGNLLFLCAELAGLLGLDAEVALHRAVRKAVSACQSPESAGN